MNISIKQINGHLYFYEWTYRKKYLRTKKKSQKYYWKYLGKINSPKAKIMLSKLNTDEKKELLHQYELKQQQLIYQKELIQSLLTQSPYVDVYNRLQTIENANKRRQQLHQLIKKIKEDNSIF